jgi:hypothetical protein
MTESRLKAAPTNLFRTVGAAFSRDHHYTTSSFTPYCPGGKELFICPLLAAQKSRLNATKTGPPSSDIYPLLYIVS